MPIVDIPVDPTIPGLTARDRRPWHAHALGLEGQDRAGADSEYRALSRALRAFDPRVLRDIGFDEAAR